MGSNVTSDEYRDSVKAAFTRDPRRLVQALGLRIDEHKSAAKDGLCLWVFDGNEADASLQIGGPGDKAGLCHRYGDGWSGDCFALVQRVRPQDGFRTRLEFVGHLYGLELPERNARPRRDTTAPALVETANVVYSVIGEGGEVLAGHHRIDYADGGKRIWWEDPLGNPNMPDGLNLIDLPLWQSWRVRRDSTRPIVICEGEKDCDAARAAGLTAVGTYGADVIPAVEPLEFVTGRRVYLWPDNDGAGATHMAAVARQLHGIAQSIHVVRWHDAPPKGGAADWFAAGNDADATRALLKSAEEWTPEDATEQVAVATDAIAYQVPDVLFRGAVPVADVALGIIERTEARRLLPRKLYGMRSGWLTLDWHYLGFKAEASMLITGMSGMGKTAVARHFLFASAEAILSEHLPDRLIFYPLEGGKDQLLHYWAGWRYGIPATLLQPGSEQHMTDEWADTLVRAYSEFPSLPIDVCDKTKDADAILFDVERRCQEGPVMGVVLDNVQELEFACGGNEYQNNRRVAFRARDIAEQYAITFVTLSQINTDGKGWKERGGPDWGNASTCRLHVDRGESGSSREEKVQSNLTVVHNIKRRYGGAPCPPLRLRGNWQTGRLYEEAAEQQGQETTTGARERDKGVDPWHSN